MVEYNIMKKWILFISTLLFTGGLLISCASTSSGNESVKKSKNNSAKAELSAPAPTAEEIFLNQLSGIKIEFTKASLKTTKNKAFSSAYEILVSDSATNPIEGFEITVSLPENKDGINLVYAQKNFTTDENGIVSFTPDVPAFAAKAQIYAYPSIPEDLSLTQNDMAEFTATADFISESDVVAKGAIMFVFEYNENGKSPKNSYDVLSGLRKKGVYQIGNAPISDSSYITASKEKIYRENYEYVGTDFGYLIGGTVTFANPVEKTDEGNYIAHMIANMYGIDMKTGAVIYEQTNEYTNTGSNWSKAVDGCRKELTALVVDSIMNGL